MGPQNAVTIAVRSPDKINKQLRVMRIFIPKFSAYLAPNNNAFNGFMSNSENRIEISINMENIGKRVNVTPEKLPSPHITNECTPSWVEKKLSRDIADEAK